MVVGTHQSGDSAHMFGRHRTTPNLDVAAALHDRLAGASVTARTDPPRVDPRLLRGRLAGSASAGLRDRLRRPTILPTA